MARKKAKPNTKAKKGGRNPPKDTRFPPGVSPNPAGRPKGSKNLRTLIMEAAHQPVIATVNGKKRRISAVHATAMRLANKAVAGNQAAMNKFFDLIDDIETRAAAARPAQFPISAADLEVLRAAYERMKQCEPENQDDQEGLDEPNDDPPGLRDSEGTTEEKSED